MDTSSIDIVERLKEVRDAEFAYVTEDYKVLTVAVEEIVKLRAALREIADWPSSRTLPSRTEHALQDIAREALDE